MILILPAVYLHFHEGVKGAGGKSGAITPFCMVAFFSIRFIIPHFCMSGSLHIFLHNFLPYSRARHSIQWSS